MDNKESIFNQKMSVYIIFPLSLLLIFLLNSTINSQRAFIGLSGNTFYQSPRKILGSAFREVRVTLADILWIKVDRYFHSSLTSEEHEMIHPGHPEHMHEHENAANQVNDSASFLPLIRLVTDLDPNFIEAYRAGGWWLWSRLNETNMAIQFFQEGIHNNPDRFELYYDLGMLYFQKSNDYYLASLQFQKAAQMKMDIRDRASVLEMQSYALEKNGDHSKMTSILQEIIKLHVAPYSDIANKRLAEYQSQHNKALRN